MTGADRDDGPVSQRYRTNRLEVTFAALQRWAADDLRSVNAQVEFLLPRALVDAGRLPPRRSGAGKASRE